MRLALALTFLLSVFTSALSQTPENPWSFDVGVNSVTIKDEDGSKLSLPTLSLSRYVFGNFSLGLNFSENNVEVSNKDLYYYSLDGIIKYDISNQTIDINKDWLMLNRLNPIQNIDTSKIAHKYILRWQRPIV